MSHYHFHRCEGCGCPGVESGLKFCGSCAVLLEGIEDVHVTVEPAREPGCDDVRKPKPQHDARWLLWAANKRGCLRFFQAFGREHGYPRNMLQWSPGMVAIAVEAKVAELQPR